MNQATWLGPKASQLRWGSAGFHRTSLIHVGRDMCRRQKATARAGEMLVKQQS